MQVAQGDLTGALKSYGAELAITQRLAQADPGNAGWQLWTCPRAYEKVGDVTADGAGRSRQCVEIMQRRPLRAIMQRLVQSDPGNAGWQFDLGFSNERVGNVLAAQETWQVR